MTNPQFLSQKAQTGLFLTFQLSEKRPKPPRSAHNCFRTALLMQCTVEQHQQYLMKAMQEFSAAPFRTCPACFLCGPRETTLQGLKAHCLFHSSAQFSPLWPLRHHGACGSCHEPKGFRLEDRNQLTWQLCILKTSRHTVTPVSTLWKEESQ